MLRRVAARLVLSCAVVLQVTNAKLITITEYPTTCKAIYTSGTRSVTIVQSTIHVKPTPWTDEDANDGKPFVLEVSPSIPRDRYEKRAAKHPAYVRSDGKITPSIADAARYLINDDGQLTSTNGGFISTSEGTRHDAFALSPTLQSISTTFEISAGSLNWQNASFPDHVAYWYQTNIVGSADQVLEQQIVVKFKGRIPPSWQQVILMAKPANDGSHHSSGQTSEHPSASPTRDVGPVNHHTQRSRSVGGFPDAMTSGGIPFPSGYPHPEGNVSPHGHCGGDDGYTCLGSDFGDCCSSHGHCGYGDRFCKNGCQPLFGICESVPSSIGASWPTTVSTGLPNGISSTVISGSSSSSYPISTYLNTGGPIGPINPLSPGASISTSSADPAGTTGSVAASQSNSVRASQLSSVRASLSSASTSSAPSVAPPCPSSAAALCGSGSNSATCSSQGGTPYNSSCGVAYTGTTIDTSNIVGLPPLRERAIENSLADCQTLCDRYPACIALNYIGTNCTLLSEVTGTTYVPGAVGAAVPPEYVPAKTNPTSSQLPASTAVSNRPSSSNVGAPIASAGAGVPTSFNVPRRSSSSQAIVSSAHSSVVSLSSSMMSLSTISEILTPSPSSTAPAVPTPSPSQVVSSSRQVMSSSSLAAMSSSSQADISSSSPAAISSSAVASSSRLPASNTPTSNAVSSMVSSNVIATSSIASSPAAVSSAAASPSPSLISNTNPVCPSANGTGFTDTTGHQYTIMCDMDFTPGAVDVTQVQDLATCINACAKLKTYSCVGITYVAGRTEIDSAACYFHKEYKNSYANAGVGMAVLTSVIGIAPSNNPPSSSEVAVSSAAISPTSSSTAVSTNPVTSSQLASSSSSSSSPSPSSTIRSSSTIASSSAEANSAFPVLPSPTPCDFGDDSGSDEDDSFCEINLPFQMQIYSQKSRNTFASTNGYISINQGSSQYSNQRFPASNIPANSVAPFFDDLYLVGDSSPQTGIYYQISNGAITYEYFLNRGKSDGAVDTSETFHFTVKYDSAQPGIFTYTYYQTGGAGDNGIYAAVGMQGINSSGNAQGLTYSFQSASIAPGLVVRCNTQANTCITVSR